MSAPVPPARPGRIRIAAAQYPIGEPASLDAWEDKVSQWVADGTATGADLLVFPEYAAIEQAAAFGSDVASSLEATLAVVADLAARRVTLHQELAEKHGVHILAGSGLVKKSDGRIVNAAQLITPKGLVGEQEKMIMTPFERDWGISPGGPLRVFDTALGVIGIAICYDCEFPLLVRALAEAGAEIVLVPSCTERVSGFHRVATGAKARALENTIVTVQSPTVGDAPWSPAVDRNSGLAAIYVPSEHGVSDTGIIAEGVLDQPMWVAGTVDLDRLGRVRATGEMRNYADWAAQPGAVALHHAVERQSLIG